jgi:hypothetical protein
MDTPAGGNGRPDQAIGGVTDPIQRVTVEHDPLKALRTACEVVAKVEPGNVHQIAALHTSMILDYYRDVRRQAQQSFIAALVAAIVGTLFFLYATWSVTRSENPWTNISLISGALIEVISAINFYLYSRAARQFAIFHVCLERTNRFLLANSMSENLTCKDLRDEARLQLIDLIANAPMLTVDMAAPTQSRRASPPRTKGAGGRKLRQGAGRRKDTGRSDSAADPHAATDPAGK